MEKVTGIDIQADWLNDLVKVSDLIYFEGPLLSHYQSISGDDYLFYWVDTDDTYNRWLVFNVNIVKIQDYLNRRISLYKLITEIDSGMLYKVDIDKDIQYHNVVMLYVHKLPESYIPDTDSIYCFEPVQEQVDLTSFSKNHNQGIFQAYFGNSGKVGYGTIDAELWANSLIQLVEIQKGLKKDFINQKRKQAKENDSHIELKVWRESTTFQYIGNTRNSFGALFKPIHEGIMYPGTKSYEDEFVDYVIGFYESSSDPEVFRKYIQGLDKKVLNSYKSFLKTITAAKTNFKLNWVNAGSLHKSSSDMDYKKAGSILTHLESLEFSDSEDIIITGKFTALNLRTGHYEFEDFEDETNRSKGYFDKDRLDAAYQIKWDKIYEVVIKRKEELKTGNKKPTITDLLISFVEQN
ncbi:DUF6575 domain-containing protein [Mangrovibacterium sp.]|uniref:DUF6575 domain-containing protein n=1 Tax=Mangrovibacterium sp. TaxID=1961364 RepID=UPI0035658E8D